MRERRFPSYENLFVNVELKGEFHITLSFLPIHFQLRLFYRFLNNFDFFFLSPHQGIRGQFIVNFFLSFVKPQWHYCKFTQYSHKLTSTSIINIMQEDKKVSTLKQSVLFQRDISKISVSVSSFKSRIFAVYSTISSSFHRNWNW